jgi:hypothetical protein
VVVNFAGEVLRLAIEGIVGFFTDAYRSRGKKAPVDAKRKKVMAKRATDRTNRRRNR